MKSSMLLGFSLMCATFLSSPTSVANDTLRGCLEVKKLTASIVKLRESNWKTISAEQLISIWPTPLEESACQSDKGCRLLVSKDRIISGHCECCEAFAFDVQQDDDGQRVERLHNVVFDGLTPIVFAIRNSRDCGQDKEQVLCNQPQRFGGRDRDRTGDPLLAKQVLSQLSYTPK
jgi:hypothetical protein